MEITGIMNVLIENAVKIMATFLLAVLTIGLTYLKDLIAQKLKMSTLAHALEELDNDIAGAVGDIQQVLVDDLKAAAEDGKLTKEEIEVLHAKLLVTVKKRLSAHAKAVIEAAGIDIREYILSEAEAIINARKTQQAAQI